MRVKKSSFPSSCHSEYPIAIMLILINTNVISFYCGNSGYGGLSLYAQNLVSHMISISFKIRRDRGLRRSKNKYLNIHHLTKIEVRSVFQLEK